MSAIFQDLRYSLRLLVKDRSFAVTALLTLALCIGANTAIFSVVRSVLLQPLPMFESDRIVLAHNAYPNAGVPRAANAVPDYFDRQRAVPALVEQAIFQRQSITFGGERGAESLIALRATPSFYQLVRMQPAAGRIFRDEEGEPGQNDRVILGHGFWQRAFGGDSSVVGQTIRLNGTPVTVVGVAPERFVFLWDDVELFLPTGFTEAEKADDRRHSNNWQMIGRMGPGATMDQVRQQISALNAANDERFPEFKQLLADAGFHTVVVGLQDDLVSDVRPVLYLLWGGVVFVLLIGCANIANLVMVRSSARTRELATRNAMGAEMGRLARQLLTESLVLAVAGGAAGVLLGWAAVRWIAALNLAQLPRGYELHLDWASVAITFMITLVVGLAIGLAPIVRLWQMNLNAELREEGRGGTGGRRAQLARRALATTQVAVAFVLLIGAGLLFASFRQVLSLDLGFQPDQVYTASLSLPASAYPDDQARTSFTARALEAIRALPEVESAGLTNGLPFAGSFNDSVVLAEGYEMKPGESLISPTQITISPGYLQAMGIGIASGRAIEDSDTADTTGVALVDERLAERFWPGRDPIGRRLYFPDDPQDLLAITEDTVFLTVVGVVGNVQLSDPRPDVRPVGTYYLSHAQVGNGNHTLAIRARTAAPGLMSAVQRTIAGLDPQLPLFRSRPMQEWIDEALTGRRVPMYLAVAFGAAGLLLAAIGIYGVLAFGVSQRKQEIGVRMALGGTAGEIFRLVLGDGLRIVTVGLAIGIAGSFFVGGLMQSQLFGVGSTDPVVLGGVTVVLGAVALGASVIPSLRAARINPMVVLGR